MKNPDTGLYEARKFFKSTNQEFVGVGTTKEEAKADLKKQLKAIRIEFSTDERIARQNALGKTRAAQPVYRLPTAETGEVKNSPGWAAYEAKDGKVHYAYFANRVVKVMARPDLAAFLKQQLEAKKRDEQAN